MAGPLALDRAIVVKILGRDIVESIGKQAGSVEPGTGTLASCSSSLPPAGAGVKLYFILVVGGGGIAQGSTGAEYTVKVDTVGPAAPDVNPEIGIGDGLLKVRWNTLTDTDVTGYRVYCDPHPSRPNDVVTPARCVPAADGSAADDAGCVTPTADTDAGAGCNTSVLVSGTLGNLIPPTLQCADITDRTSNEYKVTGLENERRYTFAVASRDLLGNVGPIKLVGCDYPSPIQDFWSRYKGDGGQAGGSYCSIGISPRVSIAALALLSCASVCLLRRRGRR